MTRRVFELPPWERQSGPCRYHIRGRNYLCAVQRNVTHQKFEWRVEVLGDVVGHGFEDTLDGAMDACDATIQQIALEISAKYSEDPLPWWKKVLLRLVAA